MKIPKRIPEGFSVLILCLLLTSCSLIGGGGTRGPNSAHDYLVEGSRYLQMGRIELSRASLLKAVALDPNGKIGSDASLLLKTRLPRHTVPTEFEQRNTIAFNQLMEGDKQAAKKTFAELIREDPEFEWPYANLAYVLIEERQFEQAQKLLNKAVSINPDYVKAWLFLAQTKRSLGDVKGAAECLERAHEIGKAEPGPPELI